MGKKWIGHARLLAKVPSTSIEYCEGYKIPRRVGSPGPRVHCFYLPQFSVEATNLMPIFLIMFSNILTLFSEVYYLLLIQ